MQHPPAVHLLDPLRAESSQPGHLGRQVVGVDVDVHAARSFAEPLHQQPPFSPGQRAAVVFAVPVELGQQPAGGSLPELQFPPVRRRRHVDDDGAQPAVVRHDAQPTLLAWRIRLGGRQAAPTREDRRVQARCGQARGCRDGERCSSRDKAAPLRRPLATHSLPLIRTIAATPIRQADAGQGRMSPMDGTNAGGVGGLCSGKLKQSEVHHGQL